MHERTTAQGSNTHYRILKRRDCGIVLEKDFRGHNLDNLPMEASVLWTLRKATNNGNNQVRGSMCSSTSLSSSRSSLANPKDRGNTAGGANKVIGLMQIVAQLQEDLGQQAGLEQMDKIYQPCKQHVPTRSGSEGNPQNEGPRPRELVHRLQEFGRICEPRWSSCSL